MLRVHTLAVLIFIISAGATLAPAQTNHQPARSTLLDWQNTKRTFILDQYSSFGGPEHDGGLFRFTTREMNTEHQLDIFTYNFPPHEHYNWYYRIDTGFRSYVGSLGLGLFAVNHQVRMDVDAGSNFTIPLYMQRTFDNRQNRTLLITGVGYNLTDNHKVGLQHTITEHKPDLDAIFYYQYGRPETGFITFEAAALDWTNRFIYQLSERRERNYDRRRKYLTHPYYFSFTATTPIWNNFRAEAMGGILTQSEVEIGAMANPEDHVTDRNRANYTGALLEWAASNITLGATWQHVYNRFSRTSVSEEAEEFVDLGNRQERQTIGAHATFRLGNLHLHNWFYRNYFHDKRFDIVERESDHYPFDFEEYRYMMKHRVVYRPPDRGPIIGLEFNADYRDMFHEYYDPRLERYVPGYDYRRYYRHAAKPRNDRITFLLGFQFTQRSFMMGGFSIDIDGDIETGPGTKRDSPNRFDGGFARLVINL